MDRLGGMHEEGGRAGGGQRGRDLARDVAGLADAADDHAPAAGEQQGHDLREAVVQPGRQILQGLAFDLQRPAGR